MKVSRVGLTLTLTLALGILVLPLAADAQQPVKAPRIGFLKLFSSPPAPWLEAFRQGLREHGWVEGQNIFIEYRDAEGKKDRYPALLAELVDRKVDVIVTWGTPAALAAKQVTRTIPIVALSGDPVGTGLVASLARPGGNVTGLAVLTDELDPKQLELLKEAVPGLSRVAVLTNPANRALAISMENIRVAAQALGVKLLVLEVRNPDELESAFVAAAREQAGALLVMRDDVLTSNRKRIVALAAQHRLPAMYGWREFVEEGGLMVYGVSFPDLWRRAAAYVDKILKGAKPADLPVEQPTKFELVINLKTAKALGLMIPQSVLIRADEVIQ